MPVPDPSWKVRTRPCPFYSQGRCLFADSCNYLHDVKIKATPTVTRKELDELAYTDSSSPVSMKGGPDLVSQRPQSMSSMRSKSPERSPRMQSLLEALGDAITPEETEVDEFEEPPVLDEPHPTTLDEEDLSGTGLYTGEDDEVHIHNLVEQDDTIRPGYSDPPPVQASTLPPDAEPSVHPPPTESTHQDPDAPFDMLSPVGMADAPPTPFPFEACGLERADSVDSGYADSWTGPAPLVLSPPRSPGPTSTLSLLSSPFGSPSQRILGSRSSIPTGILLSPSKASFPKDSPTRNNDVGDITPHYTASHRHPEDDMDSLDSFDLDDGPAIRETLPKSASPTLQYGSISPVDSFDRDHHPSANSTLSDVNPSTSGLSGILAGYYESNDQQADSPKADQPIEGEAVLQETSDPYEGSSLLSEILPDYGASDPSPRATPRAIESNDLDDSTSLSAPYEPADGESVLSYGDETSYLSSTIFSSFPLPPAGVPRAGSSSQSPPEHPEELKSPRTGLVSAPRVFSPPAPTLQSPSIKVYTVPQSPVRPRSSLAVVHRAEADVARPVRGAASEGGSDYSEEQGQGQAVVVAPVLPSKKIPFGFRRKPVPLVGMEQERERERESSLSPSDNQAARLGSPMPARSGRMTRSVSPTSSVPRDNSVDSSSRLRPLRLSRILSPSTFDFSEAGPSTRPLSANSFNDSSQVPISTPKSPSVSSEQSISELQLLSSNRSSLIPKDIRNMLARNHPASSSSHSNRLSNFAPPLSAPINRPLSWLKLSQTRPSSRTSLYEHSPARALSRLSEPAWHQGDDDASDDDDDHDDMYDPYDHTIRKPLSALPGPARSRPVSMLYSPVVTPRPTLMFAIASDDVDEVRRVLDGAPEGEPNAQVGPQSALAFTLTNEGLRNKIRIVKELLAHGADPAALRDPEMNPPEAVAEEGPVSMALMSPPPSTTLEGMDPATRYYISMADNPNTRRASALIHRSFFRPLARVRYDIVGQDRALEQLFRVLSMHSQQFSVAPLVVLLCGPSGHGKSLLARKFGSLLEVPTHTVNMTTLQSQHDIWRSHSMNPYEEPSSSTLAEFLIDNEGKRCVVVLDEIDKTEDEKFLLSLLMPWEIGRCSPEAGRRHIDVRNVIWIGTSNIGHDLVFAHEAERPDPYSKLSREEYVELMRQLRPVVSDRLGASLVSRVTTVLPFVPFTEDEKMALAAEALFTLGKDVVQSFSPEMVEGLIRRALDDYIPDEGARCLYRSVSTLLLDFSM